MNRADENAEPRVRRVDLAGGVVMALVCACFMVLRWKKMGSLLWLDPARWLHEFSRVARGEMPYRDFSFQYPPFAPFFYGWLLRWFGITFSNAQIITDVIDLALIGLCVVLIRRLLPRALQLPVAIFLVAVCATSLMNFNLFSFVTYIPSIQTGAVGALLLLLGLLRIIDRGHAGAAGWVLIASGGFIAVLSKPEYAMAALCAVALTAWIQRDWGLAVKLAMVVVGPALVVYASLAKMVGLSNLLAGIGGYGLATAFCPWWPTGVGVFGILAALGEAALVGGLLTIFYGRLFADRYGARYRTLLWGSVLGGVIYAAYIANQNWDALTANLTLAERIRRIGPSLIYTSAILQPIVWVSIVTFLVYAWRLIRRGDRSRETAEMALVLVWPVVMSSRSLFGSTQNIYPEATAVVYPFLLILGPYLLWRFLSAAAPPRYAVLVVASLTIGYSLVRVAGGWSDLLSHRHYGVLDTPAGTVKLLEYETDAPVFRYVMEHTAPGDYVLDIPYGGGLNFASGRRSPIFTTQLAGMGYPKPYQDLDLARFRENPARLVIAENEANLGAYWGFGMRGNRACPCPRLVWAPDRPSWDAAYVFPLVKYIEEQYRVAARFGHKLVLEPAEHSHAILK